MEARNRILMMIVLLFAAMAADKVQGQNHKQAATSPSDADADFAFLGEYYGCVSGHGIIGLQVVPLGGGQFSAMVYRGGLPGNGWDRTTRFQLAGKSQRDSLQFKNSDLRIDIRGVHAQVHGPTGKMLGELRKMDRRSRTLGARPPANAQVLFDGRDATAFKNARVKNGLLQIGTELIPRFRDFRFHIEFMVPYMPHAKGQGRGNSGVYLQSRYEVQILDSFGLEGKFNECGALYRYQAPNQNMAFPPLSWQTYDITFQAPRFDANGEKTRNGRITVLHNGVPVHSHFELERKTGAGRKEGADLFPIKLQDHGNPVQFRNIWIVDRSACHPRSAVQRRFR
ncbi:MAG: DUF1080 domain-containing protein [Planctomycetaceae bacterium]|nr:DUF1080 domain-containing protein [Planctomycetaceae bacterium]